MSDEIILFEADQLSKFALGGAQLGMQYGIANTHGQPTQEMVKEVLQECYRLKVNVIDTAQGYGDSERAIGRALKDLELDKQFHVVSKLDPSRSTKDFSWVVTSIKESLANLNIKALWGLMLHRFDWTSYLNLGLKEALMQLREEGLVKHLGISVFNTNELEACENLDLFKIFQVPCNLWVPGLHTKKIAKRFFQKGKLVFVRSIFLQGLLLMGKEEVEKKAPFASIAFSEWQSICKERQKSPWELCLEFAKSLEVPIVIGIDSKKQLMANSSFWNCKKLNDEDIQNIYSRMSKHLNEKIVNPYLWYEK